MPPALSVRPFSVVHDVMRSKFLQPCSNLTRSACRGKVSVSVIVCVSRDWSRA